MNPLVLIALGLAGLGAALALAPERVRAERVLLVGDSHSEAAWTFGGRVVAKLEEAGIPLVVRKGNRGKGVGWYNTSGTLRDEVASVRPDLLIVSLGGNDAGSFQESSYAAALGQFVDTAKAGGVKHIIWFGPPRADKGLAYKQPARQEVANWQGKYLPGMGVQWHDSMRLTEDLPTRDGVHYARGEYDVWASRALAGPLQRAVA